MLFLGVLLGFFVWVLSVGCLVLFLFDMFYRGIVLIFIKNTPKNKQTLFLMKFNILLFKVKQWEIVRLVEMNSIRIMIFVLNAAMSSNSMARRKRGWLRNLKLWTMVRK